MNPKYCFNTVNFVSNGVFQHNAAIIPVANPVPTPNERKVLSPGSRWRHVSESKVA